MLRMYCRHSSIISNIKSSRGNNHIFMWFLEAGSCHLELAVMVIELYPSLQQDSVLLCSKQKPFGKMPEAWLVPRLLIQIFRTSIYVIYFSLDPRKNNLVEIILDVNVSQLTERQKGMFIRQIGVLLGVLDSDITVQKIQPYTEQR